MTSPAASSQIQQITQEIDRLIAEMMTLRQRVLSLETTMHPAQSVRSRSYFGMWAGRDDLQSRTSREQLAEQQSSNGIGHERYFTYRFD